MTCSIALGPNSDFELILPSGRRLYVPANERAGAFIHRILYDAQSVETGKRGYIGKFPTQATIDEWSKFFGDRRREMRREELKDKYGFDITSLDIDI